MLNWIVRNRTEYCIKMDLVLNNLQRLICNKTKPTNQPIERLLPSLLLYIVSWWKLRPSSVFSCQTLEPSKNSELNPLFDPRWIDCSNSVNHNKVLVLSFSKYSSLFTCCWDWTCNFQMSSIGHFYMTLIKTIGWDPVEQWLSSKTVTSKWAGNSPWCFD